MPPHLRAWAGLAPRAAPLATRTAMDGRQPNVIVHSGQTAAMMGLTLLARQKNRQKKTAARGDLMASCHQRQPHVVPRMMPPRLLDRTEPPSDSVHMGQATARGLVLLSQTRHQMRQRTTSGHP